MALGYSVHLIGVPGFSYKDTRVTAWRADPPWFDGWELGRDPRMKGCGYPLAGLFTAAEARKLHERFKNRVREDGSIEPTEIDAKIVSEDDGSFLLPDRLPPSTVAELDELLSDKKLEWVIIELWDKS